MGLEVADLGGEGGGVAGVDVGRVADREVEAGEVEPAREVGPTPRARAPRAEAAGVAGSDGERPGERSVATARAPAISSARVTARQPEPVPTSRIRGEVGRRRPAPPRPHARSPGAGSAPGIDPERRGRRTRAPRTGRRPARRGAAAPAGRGNGSAAGPSTSRSSRAATWASERPRTRPRRSAASRGGGRTAPRRAGRGRRRGGRRRWRARPSPQSLRRPPDLPGAALARGGPGARSRDPPSPSHGQRLPAHHGLTVA